MKIIISDVWQEEVIVDANKFVYTFKYYDRLCFKFRYDFYCIKSILELNNRRKGET